jgi:hypothetical protein
MKAKDMPRLEGRDELEAACAAFSELNKGVISWYEDRKHKVRIPPAQITEQAPC